MRHWRTGLAAVLALAWTASAHGDPIIVPTEMCRGYFFVPVTLPAREDRPEDRTLWFLYDTGASSSFLDPDSIERISGQRVAVGQRARISEASLGSLTVSMSPRVTELDHLSIALGREIDGILAFDAFDDFLTTLDYVAGEIRVEPGELPRPDNETVYSARGRDDRPWLRVRFEGRTRRMLIDSGAGGTAFAVNHLDRYRLNGEARPVGASVRFRTIEYRDGGRLADPAYLGRYRIEVPVVSELPETELIGGRVMEHFTWTFDQRNDRVRIVPNRPGEAVIIPGELHHGLAMRPVADGLRVEQILPGGGAEGHDIREGDVITHVQGRPVRDRGCEAGDFDTWTVTRLRDGESDEVTFPLVVLVE